VARRHRWLDQWGAGCRGSASQRLGRRDYSQTSKQTGRLPRGSGGARPNSILPCCSCGLITSCRGLYSTRVEFNHWSHDVLDALRPPDQVNQDTSGQLRTAPPISAFIRLPIPDIAVRRDPCPSYVPCVARHARARGPGGEGRPRSSLCTSPRRVGMAKHRGHCGRSRFPS
jgi:hypothetical protein